ncbi:hypothetical protein [Bacillus sp. V5-8f]|uniref:hypothetical protein n=1 Tax=Bacillus sp. V5-8f TaxID=2053044 RepID=UPI000C75C970|nr:hypothetical protein [Bacillus sp. V5-8f]PLT35392.1 hypothetical protein CUU64_01900 [Bacillus sp. V5-8f]
MKTYKLKKIVAGIAMATFIGSSVPAYAGAQVESYQEEGNYYSYHQPWHEYKHIDNQNDYMYNNRDVLNQLEQGEQLGSLTVASVEKGETTTTVTFTDDIKVNGFYHPETGQFFLKRKDLSESIDGYSTNADAVVVKNQAEVSRALEGHSLFDRISGTLSNIQMESSGNDLTLNADLNNVEPLNWKDIDNL